MKLSPAMTANEAMQLAMDAQGYIVLGTDNDYYVGYVSHNPVRHQDDSVLDHCGLVVIAPATREELCEQYRTYLEPVIGPMLSDPSRWQAFWKVTAE
jgi:hypothetical protein